MPEGDITFVIRADTAQGQAAVKQMTAAMRHMSGEISQTTSRLTAFEEGIRRKVLDASKLALAGTAAALAGISAASIKLAVDAVESENLFSVSMGNMAGSARRWSEELSDSLGVNAFQIRKTVGTFDIMLKSMGLNEQAAFNMAKGLTQLSQDMASFFNLRPDEAFLKLQSGITGEIEPLRRLGIIVNETTVKQAAYAAGIARTGAQLTEAQKVQGRYLAIMQQTAAAQGDLARTIDSPANAMRVLRSRTEELMIQLGTGLLPAFREAVGVLSDWVAALDSAAQAAGGFSRIGIFRDISEFIVKVRLVNLEIQEWKLRLESAAFTAAALFAILKNAPLEAIGFFRNARDAANEAAAVEGLWNARLSESIARLNELGTAGTQVKIPNFGAGTVAVGDPEAMKRAQKEAKQLEESRQQIISGLVEEAATFGMTAQQIQIYKLETLGASQAQLEFANAVALTIQDQMDFKRLSDETQQSITAYDQKMDALAQSVREFALSDQEKLNRRFEEFNLLLRTGRIDLDTWTKAVAKAQDEIDFARWEKETNGLADGMDNARKAASDFALVVGRGFENAIIHGQGLRGVLAGIATDLASMIFQLTVIKPLSEALGASKGFGGLFSFFAGLFRQEGGPVSPFQPYIVGERGPELFVPQSSGQIVPSGKLGGGTTFIYNIDARGADIGVELRIRRAIEEASQRTLAASLRLSAEAHLRTP